MVIAGGRDKPGPFGASNLAEFPAGFDAHASNWYLLARASSKHGTVLLELLKVSAYLAELFLDGTAYRRIDDAARAFQQVDRFTNVRHGLDMRFLARLGATDISRVGL